MVQESLMKSRPLKTSDLCPADTVRCSLGWKNTGGMQRDCLQDDCLPL